MMYNMEKLFTGFTMCILQLKSNLVNVEGQEKDQKCTPYKEALYYDCSERQLLSFPHDQLNSEIMNSEVEILNISSTLIEKLIEDDLKPYTNLREIVMRRINSLSSLSPDFLTPVQNLEVFIMDYTDLKSVIKLPEKLEVFHADNVSITTNNVLNLDFTKLINLAELSLAKNGIEGLPSLNPKAPLVHINLKDNPITNIEYTDLAPFCQLDRFELEEYTPGRQSAEKCCPVVTWLIRNGVYTELICSTVNGKECDPKKPFEFSNEALALRGKCLDNNESPFEWGFAAGVVAGTVILLLVIFLMINRYTSRSVKKNTETVEKPQESDPNTNDEESVVDMGSIVFS